MKGQERAQCVLWNSVEHSTDGSQQWGEVIVTELRESGVTAIVITCICELNTRRGHINVIVDAARLKLFCKEKIGEVDGETE